MTPEERENIKKWSKTSPIVFVLQLVITFCFLVGGIKRSNYMVAAVAATLFLYSLFNIAAIYCARKVIAREENG